MGGVILYGSKGWVAIRKVPSGVGDLDYLSLLRTEIIYDEQGGEFI